MSKSKKTKAEPGSSGAPAAPVRRFGGTLNATRIPEALPAVEKPANVSQKNWDRMAGAPVGGPAVGFESDIDISANVDANVVYGATKATQGKPAKGKATPSNAYIPKSPNGLGRPREFTEDQIAAALKATRGNYTRAAAALSKAVRRMVTRQTIALYVNRSEALQKLKQEIVEIKLDIVEDLAYDGAMRGDSGMQRFVLSTQGAHRGWGKKTEVTGKDGKAIEVGIGMPFDLGKLDNAQLAAFEQLLTLAATGIEA